MLKINLLNGFLLNNEETTPVLLYAFELIPDITKLEDFPTDINDKTIADYFNFSQEEREIIEKYPEYIYF